MLSFHKSYSLSKTRLLESLLSPYTSSCQSIGFLRDSIVSPHQLLLLKYNHSQYKSPVLLLFASSALCANSSHFYYYLTPLLNLYYYLRYGVKSVELLEHGVCHSDGDVTTHDCEHTTYTTQQVSNLIIG